jgi:hypothetical protein
MLPLVHSARPHLSRFNMQQGPGKVGLRFLSERGRPFNIVDLDA